MDEQGDPGSERASDVAGELRAVIGRLRRRLRDEGHPGGLTSSQISVLGHLDREGPTTVTGLARTEGVRPQSMGAIVSALEASGLVTGAADPADKRQTILSLTTACRDMIAASRAAKQDWLFRAIRTKLDAAELEALATGVELLKRLVDLKP